MTESFNALEESLKRAATDASYRPQFYRDLLDADVFAITDGQPLDIRDGMLTSGSRVSLQSWERDGIAWIPIFSSLERLQQAIQTNSRFLRMNARALFDLTRGAHVVLNPGQSYGKELMPGEIARMLDGSIFMGQRITIQQETRVMIGQPSAYPQAMVDALAALFSRTSQVRAAYLAQYIDPQHDSQPHLLVGIDFEGERNPLVGDAGSIAAQTATGRIVDIIRIDGNDLSRYLVATPPFYKRSLLRGIFG